ncbi:NIPSNAP family protein [Paenibacillus sp. Dod16]|uniref:NIPSNAP family protein n=1 Tax=Paenibacillus TaxID=44249 RepID=UPI000BF94895|nr:MULTISPECIES: NIPSNAP family protein [Paenibacillus]GIO99972.1 hypothetical protein J14TS5_50580 [Paenibacillus lautus]
MIYRRKSYKIDSKRIDEFNHLFNEYLLPTQLKYGASLVGRWMTEEIEGVIEVFAIWEYKSLEEYQNIENQVKGDEEHVKRVRNQHEELRIRGENLLKEAPKEDFLLSTVPRNKTILSNFS